MSALGHKRTLKRLHPMSALSPKAGAAECVHHVRYVPKAELNAIHFPLTRGCHTHEESAHSMMPALLDFWFDFASTYSYPAAMRVAPLAWQSGVMVRFRPFLLGPL